MAENPMTNPLAWNLVAEAYAAEVTPVFEAFASDALRLAGLQVGWRIVDVACGPGTLSGVAARRGAHVSALDFSTAMVAALQARIDRGEVPNTTAVVGDGQDLPFADATFDAGFSLFGLFFFPDRARGLRELRRVVRPGGAVVVSGWEPLSEVPAMTAIFDALAEVMPGGGPPPGPPPLGDEASARAEMTAAGYSAVRVERAVHCFDAPDAETWFGAMERTLAPMVLLKHNLGAAWPAVRARLRAGALARMSTGPVVAAMPALLIRGTV